MSKNLLLILSLAVIGVTAYVTLVLNSYSSQLPKSEVDIAINQAKYFYNLAKTRGEDLSRGPCLSDALLPDWSLDIVHSPRISIDDLPENQCPSYRAGKSKHFVELDLNGNLIRAF